MPKATLLKFGTLRHLCSSVNLNIFLEQILLRQPTECCFYRGPKLSKILSITKCLEFSVFFFIIIMLCVSSITIWKDYVNPLLRNVVKWSDTL